MHAACLGGYFGLTGIGRNWRRMPWNLILRTTQTLSWAVAAKVDRCWQRSQHFCEDPRGINPPFGKTHTHNVEEVWQCSNVWLGSTVGNYVPGFGTFWKGSLTMFPSWASHFITPNMKSRTAVHCSASLFFGHDAKAQPSLYHMTWDFDVGIEAQE